MIVLFTEYCKSIKYGEEIPEIIGNFGWEIRNEVAT